MKFLTVSSTERIWLVQVGVMDFHTPTCKGRGVRITRHFWSCLEFLPAGGPEATFAVILWLSF